MFLPISDVLAPPGAAMGLGKKKPAVTAAEIAAVELDKEDEQLLDEMEQEAEARGEAFDSEEEREKLKALKAEQAKQRMKKMRLGGHGSRILFWRDGYLSSTYSILRTVEASEAKS